MTPNLATIWREVHKRFSDVGSMGVFNCRLIANSKTWSQHSWRNAWDITSPSRVLVMGPRTRFNPLHMAYMDRVHDYLRLNRESLNIRTLLWRTTAHWDHIHVDMWPKGIRIPPCAGGTLFTQDKDGTIRTDWGDEDMAAAVEGIQRNLNLNNFRDMDGNELAIDGEWGPKTEFAHNSMCEAAAKEAGGLPDHTHGLATVNKTGPVSSP